MDLTTVINLFILIILLALTAFFVGSEFAVVKIRISRLEQLIAEGNKKAVTAKKVAGDLDYYLSACQLGITVTALGLGAIGKPAVKSVLSPVFSNLNLSDSAASAASYAIAFILVTFLHVVVGEMAPKTLAIQFSEKMTLMLATPLYWFGKWMYPFIWALNGASRVLLRMFGVKPFPHEQAYSEDELKIIMTQSFQGGAIDESKLDYMENVFSFDERAAKNIMVPRTSIVALDLQMTDAEIVQVLDQYNYTRYPVVENGDKDRVVGIVNVKKMLPHIVAGRKHSLSEYVRELPSVLEVTSIQQAMLLMQQERVHMALVIDEFGGTSGILTMEDILEELVGEIRDEFDADEIADIQMTGNREFVIHGRVLLDDLEKELGISFGDREDVGVDTIGGWIQVHKGAVVSPGDELRINKFIWTIEETDHLQIKQVRVRPLEVNR